MSGYKEVLVSRDHKLTLDDEAARIKQQVCGCSFDMKPKIKNGMIVDRNGILRIIPSK